MKTLRWLSMALTDPQTVLAMKQALERRLFASVMIAAAGCVHAPSGEPPRVVSGAPAPPRAAAAHATPQTAPEVPQINGLAVHGHDDQAWAKKRLEELSPER
ncbi:MAG: hypothetical protein IPJ65_17260 [Archangiaceae bacterium]|nr:hypothetical protein [Archangiaceae bacterium]